MAFQKITNAVVLSSFSLTCLLVYYFNLAILNPLIPLIATLLFAIQAIAVVAYNIFVWPHISPLRHLPCAPQKHPLKRLLKEPCPWHFEAWINSVPNGGLIRYYGILNIERVLVTSPDAVKTILQTKVYNFHKQYHQKAYFEKVQGYGLVLQEDNHHKHARKLIGHTLSQRRVVHDYWSIIQRKVSEMMQVVIEAVDLSSMSEKPHSEPLERSAIVTMDELIQRAVFDVAGEVSYGIDFDSVLAPEKNYNAFSDYNNAFLGNKNTRLRLLLGFIFPKWILDILPIRFNFTTVAGMRHFKKIGREFMARTTIDVAEAQPLKSIMHELIAGKQMSNEELWEQYLMMQPGAIHNTTSGMFSVLWYLSQPRYIHVQHRLHEELQTALQSVDDSDVSLATFEKLPYLRAVINEVLRLHPPASWFGREV